MEKDQHNQQDQQGGNGRLFGRGPQENEAPQTGAGKNDISSMDQQEGLMHNGETGGSGNFGQPHSDGGNQDQQQ